jgi:hypothetical protein
MHSKYDYTINALHDCVLLHPNFVPSFFDDIVRNDLSSTSIPILDKLEQQYRANCCEFFDELKNLNPRFLYKPES